MKTQENTDILQTVDLSFDVLGLVAHNPDLTLSDIAKTLGQTKPRVLRILRTLEHRKYIRRVSGRFYRLGIGALVLGTAASSQVDLIKTAAPILETIGSKVNETTQLRIVESSTALCIAKFEPSRDLRVQALIGRRRPLHAGSSKVLLAYLPPASQLSLIPELLTVFTEQTITDRELLLRELNTIKHNGYCISHGEISEHLIAVAVPVLTADGSLLAAINIAAPAFRTKREDIKRYISILKEASAQLTAELMPSPN